MTDSQVSSRTGLGASRRPAGRLSGQGRSSVRRLAYLDAGVLAHAQAAHPHLCQQDLAAGVSEEVAV